jgi:hypothetical protein
MLIYFYEDSKRTSFNLEITKAKTSMISIVRNRCSIIFLKSYILIDMHFIRALSPALSHFHCSLAKSYTSETYGVMYEP